MRLHYRPQKLAVQRDRRGRQNQCLVFRLMLTCRASRVEPLAWLRHVLTEFPKQASDADISDLLPFKFTKAADT